MPKSFLDLINDAYRGGIAVIFPDAAAASLARGVWPMPGVQNFSTAAQTPSAAVRTYITGSALAIPGNVRPGTVLKWKFNITKDANGSATSTFDICVGTTGTTTDTARVSFTKPAGTAVADEGWVEIVAIVRSVSATGVVVGEFTLGHNLAATGHAVIPVVAVNTVSSGFDNSAAGLVFGVCITSGAADAITIQQVIAECAGL
jgi:hypothetical protein